MKVSDTALWVAMYRAWESERPDALFHDPHARRMAGEDGKAMVNALTLSPAMAWSMVVRTAVMDEIIQRCVALGARTVLNLGAGLDTRAFRLDLPAELHWVDVDLPGMVAHREHCLHDVAPSCRHVEVSADLTDPGARVQLLDCVREHGGPAMVVSEGLLAYLTPGQVSGMARQLHTEPLVRWWLTDLITPFLLNTVGAFWRMQMAAAGTPFKFAPDNSEDFFASLGWREAEFHSIWSEALRLNRAAIDTSFWSALTQLWLPGARERVRRMSGVALFERGAD